MAKKPAKRVVKPPRKTGKVKPSTVRKAVKSVKAKRTKKK